MIPDPQRQELLARKLALELEIAQLEKARLELLGMSDEVSPSLTFEYVPNKGWGFPGYSVLRDGCMIAELSCKSGGVFYNDKYESYTPQEMREMADFMTALEASLKARGYVFNGVVVPPRLDLLAGVVKEYYLYWKANLLKELNHEDRTAVKAAGWTLTQNSHCYREAWQFNKVDWDKTRAAWAKKDAE